MNKHKACEILGILPDAGIEELKKRYHLLMVVTHPDSVSEHDYPYEVHEINRAYEYMLDHLEEEQIREKTLETKRIRWNAPVNPNAFAARPIYQYYEDEDGNRLGLMTVDQGRYMWIPDEEFSLFLKSLYTTAKEIIARDDEVKHIDRSRDMSLMGDITYLIAGQFFGADMAFSLMKWDESSESYYSKAMLELAPGKSAPNDGDILIPGSVRDHRLYLRDKGGHELGYLTFKDDRLLFGIIPLFERRAVKLKAVVHNDPKHKRSARPKSVDVDLWLRHDEKTQTSAIESINLQIQTLLDQA